MDYALNRLKKRSQFGGQQFTRYVRVVNAPCVDRNLSLVHFEHQARSDALLQRAAAENRPKST